MLLYRQYFADKSNRKSEVRDHISAHVLNFLQLPISIKNASFLADEAAMTADNCAFINMKARQRSQVDSCSFTSLLRWLD